MVILGGMGSFWGPAVGAAALALLNHQINAVTQYWPLVLGIGADACCCSSSRAASSGARARASACGAAMLEARDLRRSFGGVTAIDGVEPGGRAPRDRRHHRPERRRQVDAVQPAHRPPAARRRQRAPRRAATSPASRRTACARSASARSFQRTNIFPQAHGVRERAGGDDRAPRPRPRPVVARRRACSATRPRRCCATSTCSTRPRSPAARCRTATRSSSSSASRSPAAPSCCCSTSRPPACRRPRRATRWRCCGASPPSAA